MKKTKGYPVLRINRNKIYENAKRVVELCKTHGINVSGVIKGADGIQCVADEFVRAGCSQIASSKLEQLMLFKRHNPDKETLLLRVPMISEISGLVKNVDYSLNSELTTIEHIEKICEKYGKQHGVILMVDLGDLREGFFNQDELLSLATHIEKKMKYVRLSGVGTNLGCYGSVKPTKKNLGDLVSLSDKLEKKIGRKLEIISGGATSSLPLLLSGEMPKGINNLRIGEAILLNMDLPEVWNIDLGGMSSDTFLLEAQIIEIKYKPSHPIGELFIDAFGNAPKYLDRGIRKRALLAVGKQDFVMDNKLVPTDTAVEIVGSSSDHLIVDIENCENEYSVGDIMQFKMFYGPMLHLCTSEWVRKVY